MRTRQRQLNFSRQLWLMLSALVTLLLVNSCSLDSPAPSDLGANAENILASSPAKCEATWTKLLGPNGVAPGALWVNNTDRNLELDVFIDHRLGWEMLTSVVFVGVGAPPTTIDALLEEAVFVEEHRYVDAPFTGHDLFTLPLNDLLLSCNDSVFVGVAVKLMRETESGIVVEMAWSQGNAITYDICCAADGCTLTQGYWKNHAESWPVDRLTLGDVTYSKLELLDLLRTSPRRGDASLILAHQLIAARMNVEAGARPPADIAAALDRADAWMTFSLEGPLPASVAPSGNEGEQARALAELLASFNEGEAGPGHCDDSHPAE